MPLVVLFVALSLFVQGAFTIGHLRGLWKHWRIPSFHLLVAGELAAALVGGWPSCKACSTIFIRPMVDTSWYPFSPRRS